MMRLSLHLRLLLRTNQITGLPSTVGVALRFKRIIAATIEPEYRIPTLGVAHLSQRHTSARTFCAKWKITFEKLFCIIRN